MYFQKVCEDFTQALDGVPSCTAVKLRARALLAELAVELGCYNLDCCQEIVIDAYPPGLLCMLGRSQDEGISHHHGHLICGPSVRGTARRQPLGRARRVRVVGGWSLPPRPASQSSSERAIRQQCRNCRVHPYEGVAASPISTPFPSPLNVLTLQAY